MNDELDPKILERIRKLFEVFIHVFQIGREKSRPYGS